MIDMTHDYMHRIFHQLTRVVLGLIVLKLSGCVWAQTVDYRGVSSFSSPPIAGKVAVTVRDQRPYVLNGHNSLTWVGATRNVYGMPFGTHTASGRPLTEDMTGLVTSTLSKGAIDAVALQVPASSTLQEAGQMVSNIGANTGLLFELNDWQTDNYLTAELEYDVTLKVIDGAGSVSGMATQKGKEPLVAGRHLPELLALIFGTLLNAAEAGLSKLSHVPVEAVITPKPTAKMDSSGKNPAAGGQPCTVSQILKMKQLGISEQQIEAACQ